MTRPLEGIAVLDFSEHGFVPSAAAVLADLGADVVKIERLRGDAMRTIIANGLVATKDGYDFQFELYNRNKRGIALDVETPAGRAVFEKLVTRSDVYVTNQLPRVRRRLRADPGDVMAINPRIVYAKGHGQGQRGADAEAGGFDGVSYWARGGVAHVLTEEDAPRPTRQRPALGDGPSGMFLAGGICAGLVHALRTGKGTVVDVSLLGSAVWTLGPDLAYATLAGEQMPMADPETLTPLMGQYRSADGRWVSLMMIDEHRYWAPACRALGLTDLIEPYADREIRKTAWPEIAERIRKVVSGLGHEELAEALRAQDCIFSVFASPVEVARDPAVVANGYLMEHPEHPDVRLAAAPAQFDDELPSVRRPGPALGEHTREILTDLGYGGAAVDRLLADGVVAQA
ncbi:CaiB/BaiF CoA-transferase family protein [Pseudonocardia sp. KRD291]|uniref:CaiB/BaiF CoA transferase family protein n=1 Tax=Pseudonocardia sp. KRD291 TaxID=2792007 RepID=UPI001C49E2CD|nr:CoA transferase [Pseudonocardia sp. KRD291]MBW0101247.1 CoA transferase [Pseudonocardia sp. KRD291]